jgi:hypothetical protein
MLLLESGTRHARKQQVSKLVPPNNHGDGTAVCSGTHLGALSLKPTQLAL